MENTVLLMIYLIGLLGILGVLGLVADLLEKVEVWKAQKLHRSIKLTILPKHQTSQGVHLNVGLSRN